MTISYEILLIIFFIETLYLIFLIMCFFLQRTLGTWLRERSTALQEEISILILDLIENKQPFSLATIPKKLLVFSRFLTVMESFNKRIQGDDWQELKHAIGLQYLLPSARRLAHSIFWQKRNKAARAFSLIAEKEDELVILSLIKDSFFLVRSYASCAAIHLESPQGILMTLEHMIQASGYARYYYTDLLLQGSKAVFSEILHIVTETQDPQMQLACAEILSRKTLSCPLPFVHKWLKDTNPHMRLQTLKILACNPQENTETFIFQALDDPDENVRVLAIGCLEHCDSEATTAKLKQYLSDARWSIRLQAALLLKKIGKTDILERQTQMDNAQAYEVAQYVLLFG